nr:hypothetical protein [Tanacetum cinerariifolium]
MIFLEDEPFVASDYITLVVSPVIPCDRYASCVLFLIRDEHKMVNALHKPGKRWKKFYNSNENISWNGWCTSQHSCGISLSRVAMVLVVTDVLSSLNAI